MFVNIEAELSTETVVEKMIDQHSLNYILYLVFTKYGYHSPEHLADKITKMVSEADEYC